MRVLRSFPKATLLAAGVHAALVVSAPAAFAQAPQPVPYNTAQVPYGQAPTGPAQPPPGAAVKVGSDVIYLKGGGILRGTIIDAIPNAQARIQLATGEIATVPWQQIDKIEQSRGGATPPAGTTPAAGTTAPPATQQPPPPPSAIVAVHVDGPDGAELQQDATGHDDWRTVCNLPCDKQLPNGLHYRIMGEGLRASRDFTLEADAGQRENINVNAASKGSFTLGVVGIVAGSTLLTIGLFTVMAGYILKASYNPGPDPVLNQNNDGSGTLAVGWIMTLIGLGAGVGGLYLTLANSKTSVSQDVNAGGGAAGGGPSADVLKPAPTWKEATVVERSAPPVFGVPILSGSF